MNTYRLSGPAGRGVKSPPNSPGSLSALLARDGGRPVESSGTVGMGADMPRTLRVEVWLLTNTGRERSLDVSSFMEALLSDRVRKGGGKRAGKVSLTERIVAAACWRR
jgi:hypothetical protein